MCGALCLLGVSVYGCQWCAGELWQNIPAAPLRPDHWMYAAQEEGKHTLIFDQTHSEEHLKTQLGISILPSLTRSHVRRRLNSSQAYGVVMLETVGFYWSKSWTVLHPRHDSFLFLVLSCTVVKWMPAFVAPTDLPPIWGNGHLKSLCSLLLIPI